MIENQGNFKSFLYHHIYHIYHLSWVVYTVQEGLEPIMPDPEALSQPHIRADESTS